MRINCKFVKIWNNSSFELQAATWYCLCSGSYLPLNLFKKLTSFSEPYVSLRTNSKKFVVSCAISSLKVCLFLGHRHHYLRMSSLSSHNVNDTIMSKKWDKKMLQNDILLVSHHIGSYRGRHNKTEGEGSEVVLKGDRHASLSSNHGLGSWSIVLSTGICRVAFESVKDESESWLESAVLANWLRVTNPIHQLVVGYYPRKRYTCEILGTWKEVTGHWSPG